jgi:transcriptional regulator with XRE-family HTH domain
LYARRTLRPANSVLLPSWHRPLQAAAQAGVTANTVTRIENGADAKQSTLEALQRALEAAGVIFVAENGDGPGVRLKKKRGDQ